jgi:hypothetical protein
MGSHRIIAWDWSAKLSLCVPHDKMPLSLLSALSCGWPLEALTPREESYQKLQSVVDDGHDRAVVSWQCSVLLLIKVNEPITSSFGSCYEEAESLR